MLMPLLSEADSRVSVDGSIDPLGTCAIAEALSVRVILLLETGRHKPIGFQPSSLRLKGLASAMERPEK